MAAGLFILAIRDRRRRRIARPRRNLVTDLGKLLDPIADKVLIGGALVALSILGELPWWVTVVILVREVGITVLRLVALRDHVIPAGILGKVKTWVQTIAISFAIVPLWHFFGELVNVVNAVLDDARGRPHARERRRVPLAGVGRRSRQEGRRGRRIVNDRRRARRRADAARARRSPSPSRSRAAWWSPSWCRSRAPRPSCAAASWRTRPTSRPRLLGVDADLLAAGGPIHPEVARQMADGRARPPRGATSASRRRASPDPTRRTATQPGEVWLGFAIGDDGIGRAASNWGVTARPSGATLSPNHLSRLRRLRLSE